MYSARVSAVGEFVAVSAFRSDDPGRVLDGVRGFLAAHDWAVLDVPGDEPVAGPDDVLAYPPQDGWTVVLWPQYWAAAPASAFVCQQLGGVSSAVSIHDGDYWTHTLLRDGETLDRFASMPDYFTDDPDEIARLAAKFAGNPAVVATAFGCPVDQLAPYLVHAMVTENLDHLLLDGPDLAPAFSDDEFDRESPWVFVDFWRRAGITYPPDVSAYAARLRLAPHWSTKLPTSDSEL